MDVLQAANAQTAPRLAAIVDIVLAGSTPFLRDAAWHQPLTPPSTVAALDSAFVESRPPVFPAGHPSSAPAGGGPPGRAGKHPLAGPYQRVAGAVHQCGCADNALTAAFVAVLPELYVPGRMVVIRSNCEHVSGFFFSP